MSAIRWGAARGRRPGLLALALGVLATLGLCAAALAAAGAGPTTAIEIVIRYSHFEPNEIVVPAGVPVTITLRNDDPIDHEWIVGDEAVHAVHRTGTELLHPSRPTEVVIPAGETRTTVVTFAAAGTLRYICHLPAHEAYGMVGSAIVR